MQSQANQNSTFSVPTFDTLSSKSHITLKCVYIYTKNLTCQHFKPLVQKIGVSIFQYLVPWYHRNLNLTSQM